MVIAARRRPTPSPSERRVCPPATREGGLERTVFVLAGGGGGGGLFVVVVFEKVLHQCLVEPLEVDGVVLELFRGALHPLAQVVKAHVREQPAQAKQRTQESSDGQLVFPRSDLPS